MKVIVYIAPLVAVIPIINGLSHRGGRLLSDAPMQVADFWTLAITTVLGLSCVATGTWIAKGNLSAPRKRKLGERN